MSNGFIFLLGTHTLVNDGKRWNDEFKDQLVYSHGKINLCSVLAGYLELKNIEISNTKSGENGWILLINLKLDDINLFFSDITTLIYLEKEIKKFNKINIMLMFLDNVTNTQIVLGGNCKFF